MIDTKALRNKILDLAISGKLTEQLPEDGNAEDLYAQIQEEKAKLIAEGKIKKGKPLLPLNHDDYPFSIPDNWIWTRFGDISFIVRGGSPRPIKQYITNDLDGVNWIKIGDVEKGGKYIYSTQEKITPAGEKRSRHVYPGDFLLTNSMSFGRPYITKVEGCIHDGWLLIRNLNGFYSDYLYYLLSSNYLYKQFCKMASGATVSNLNIDKVNNSTIPLPPLPEQKRIVSIVEDTFSVIDRIEKAQDSYYADQEVLKNKIIDAGIRGKLTEQLPEDGNAGDLYVQIQEEKNKLIAEGTIKKEKTLPPITEEEIPFEIPENWKWVRLADISKVISKGTTPRGGKAAYIEKGIGFLRAENLGGYDRLNKNSLKYIDERTHNGFLKRSILEQDDILISIAGTLGRTAIVRKDDLPLNANQAIAFIRLILNDIASSRFISYILNASSVQIALGNKKVAMAIPNLSLEVISNIIIPIPPLPEQKRINSVIEKAFALINI